MDYDLVIIGAGWAGVSAARQACLCGLKTALIEEQDIGGTCLNRGCIPTKSLLEAVHKTPVESLDLSSAQARTQALVLSLRQGLQSALKGVDLYAGRAELIDASHVSAGGKTISARFMIIATGSQPRALGSFAFDHTRIVSSDDMLGWTKAPRSLLVIGAGALGMEFAELFAACGTAVTLVEAQPRILPPFDHDISRKVLTSFEKKGIVVRTGISVTAAEAAAFEKVAVCVGRQPLTGGLNLDKLGIKRGSSGITVNDYLQTSVPTIYAVGDCNGLNMQAHVAALQARIAVEAIAAGAGTLRNPSPFSSFALAQAVFTRPQAAGVGLTEEQARAIAAQVGVKSLAFITNGLARIRDEKDGLVKVIWDAQTDRLLGAWVFGAQASEQIGLFSLALQNGLTRLQCRQAVMVHPSLSESLVEVLN